MKEKVPNCWLDVNERLGTILKANLYLNKEMKVFYLRSKSRILEMIESNICVPYCDDTLCVG